MFLAVREACTVKPCRTASLPQVLHAELHLALALLVPELPVGLVTFTQLDGLLEDFHVLALEHDDPRPARFVERPQKGSFGIPGVGGDAVKKAGAVKAPDAAQQAQGRGAFVFAGADRLNVQQEVEPGPAKAAWVRQNPARGFGLWSRSASVPALAELRFS
jgi:hypothetical protein